MWAPTAPGLCYSRASSLPQHSKARQPDSAKSSEGGTVAPGLRFFLASQGMTSRKIRGGGICRTAYRCALVLSLCAMFGASAQAQSVGVTTQGATGGLVIPSADVLPTGTAALTYGNYEEPQLGVNSVQQDESFGIGLLNHVELFGRVTNYTNPIPGSIFANGTRDLSANVKLQLPTPWTLGPKLAVGLNDFAGGAANFKSRYLVATSHYGPLDVSLGYAQGAAHGHPPTFDGAFSGLEWHLGNTGLSLLAESDGKQDHAGLRWHSPPLAALGRAQLVGSLQHSFKAVTPAGANADATTFSLSLVMPLGDEANARAQAEACAPTRADTPRPGACSQRSLDKPQPTVDFRSGAEEFST
jgi:Exopolysaccharide biosynthesis protein YbjH